MKLDSSDIDNGRMMTYRCTREYGNCSPSMTWTEVPEGTVEFALRCICTTKTMDVKTHWLVYKIPITVTGIPAGLNPNYEVPVLGNCMQGLNDFGSAGYDGPSMPWSLDNMYIFTLYALREPLALGHGAMLENFMDAIEGKIIEQAELFGLFYVGQVGAEEYR
ncbi:MAG TPA: YbhB/YbcL family Raf kinase inhibitor-like protein [bacterium]|jgi:hypothetical protein